MLTMSSTAFPNVAFTRPPSVSPRRPAISSVANERTAAKGIMAKKLRVNTHGAPHSSSPAMIPKGTKTRRRLIHAVSVSDESVCFVQP